MLADELCILPHLGVNIYHIMLKSIRKNKHCIYPTSCKTIYLHCWPRGEGIGAAAGASWAPNCVVPQCNRLWGWMLSSGGGSTAPASWKTCTQGMSRRYLQLQPNGLGPVSMHPELLRLTICPLSLHGFPSSATFPL